MKRILRRLLRLLPAKYRDRLHAFKHRRNWNRRLADEYRKYFDDYQTRDFLVELMREHAEFPDGGAIFEFGCSGGNNLRLFRERLHRSFGYIGIDLAVDAIRFAQSTFPDADFHEGDDRTAINLLDGVNFQNVFLASGVLSYLPENRCLALLKAASSRCRYLVLCDQLDRYQMNEGAEEGIYLHPYARLFRESGWETTTPIISSREGHMYRSLVARSVHLMND